MKAQALFDVTGHVALVTGAASGLGLAFTEVMADNGALVVMVDVNASALAESAQKLISSGRSVEPVVADVGNADAIGAAVDGAVAKHGRLDAVFANAGISAGPGFASMPDATIANAPRELWDLVIRTNLTGTFLTVRAAAEQMKRRRGGRIVITSSTAGPKAEALVGYGYVTTKAAIANLARQAALELAPYNVTVNAIVPGPLITNLAGGRTWRDPTARALMEARVPLHRLANTTEIQGLGLLLGSPASSFITGALIPIDGGVLAW